MSARKPWLVPVYGALSALLGLSVGYLSAHQQDNRPSVTATLPLDRPMKIGEFPHD